jgi:glycerol-3-phosphate acyltransferase PlsX
VSFKDRSIILADVGANVDCKPEWLAQFALMSNLYAKRAMGVSNPRVALLSNGEEETKGNNLIHETAALLKEMDLNFIGNVEPIGMVHAEADVLICDGFVGNVVAKTIEATGSIMLEALRDEIMRNMFRKLGGLILRQAFRDVYRQFDPFEIGGVPLLGVNGVVIIGHGRSNALAIKNAIRQAKQAVDGGIVDAIREGISAYENTNA